MDLLPENYDVSWFKLPVPEALREGCSIAIAVAVGKHPVIYYTSWDGRLQYGLVTPKGNLGERRGKDWVRSAIEPAPLWLAEHVLDRRDESEGPTRLNVLVGRSQRWTVSGVLLLGDAAHRMSPVRAQGINLALRDAIVAANHLVPVLKGAWIRRAGRGLPCRTGRARARYRARPEAPASGSTGQGDARSGNWRFGLTKRGARLLGRYRWAKNAWLERQRDLRFGSTEVKLQILPPGK